MANRFPLIVDSVNLNIKELPSGDNLDLTGSDALFGDNDKAIFGAGSDLQLYHSGSHSFISEAGTGDLYIGASNNIALMNAAFSENKLLATTDGALNLYYDGSQKLATTATGIDVTGVITTDGMTTSATVNFPDGVGAYFGTGNDLQIYHSGTESIIADAGTGNLNLRGQNQIVLATASGSETYAAFNVNGASQLYYDNAAKLATTATGIDVTGNVSADEVIASSIISSSSTNPRLRLFETDTTDLNTQLQNQAGDFFIKTIPDDASTSTSRFAIDHSTGDISFYEDTGTTAKLTWDASAESLGIGTSSPEFPVTAYAATGQPYIGSITTNVKTVLASDETNLRAYIGTRTNHPISFVTDGDERMRINSSGNVGIGVVPASSSSPTWQHIQFGGTGNLVARKSDTTVDAMFASNYYVNASEQDTYITNGAAARMFINDNVISFDQAASGTAGDAISFSEAMRIDSSGNLLVGQSSSTTPGIGNTTLGSAILAGGLAAFSRAGGSANATLYVNKNTDNGPIVRFSKDGSEVGSIGTAGGDLTVGTGDTGLTFEASADVIHPINQGTGAARDNAIDLGKSAARFKDLYLSGIAKVGSGAFDVGGLQHSYGSDANSRSWWLKTDTHGYGDFALRQSTTKTGSTYETKLLIDASGNVGIGATTVDQHLHVEGAGTQAIKVETTADDYAIMQYKTSTSSLWQSFASPTNDYRIGISGTGDAITIDSSLNVGIGTSSANSRKLRVYGSGDLVELVSTNTGVGGAQIDLKHESTSPADGDSIGIINFNGYDNGSNGTRYANITGKAGSVSLEKGELHFGTRTSASTYEESQMVIDSSGKIQIGNNIPMWSGLYGGALFLKGNNATTDRYAQLAIVDSTGAIVSNGLILDDSGNVGIGVTSIDAKLKVQAATGNTTFNCFNAGSGSQTYIAFNLSGGGVATGSITTNGSTTAYNTSSDYRLKENVVPLTGATERVKQLNPTRFNFIADADVTVDGFLAHEVADVVPEAITGTKDGMRDEEYEVTPAVYEDVVIPAVLDEEGNEVEAERTEQQLVSEAVMGTRSVPDYQGIDQSKLVPLLVATIQELEARITALESN